MKNKQKTLLQKLDNFFEPKLNKTLIVCLIASFIITLFNFDGKVSIGGDDSFYIQAAYDYINGTSYPNWHGTFYPVFLSLFVALFGVNLIALKLVSALLVLVHLYFFFQTFKKITPPTVLFFTLIAISGSLMMAKYGSLTYSEPFFMALQSILIFTFYKFIDINSNSEPGFKDKKLWLNMLALAIVAYLLANTRFVAYAGVLAIIIILISFRKFKNLGAFIGSFALIHVVHSFYKKTVWGVKSMGMSEQFSAISRKNFYQEAKGHEDFMGFVKRFWENSESYLSKDILKLLGFKDYSNLTYDTTPTIILYGILIVAATFIVLKRKKMILPLLYVVGLISATFIALQIEWRQERLIMVYFPMLLIIVLTGFYELVSQPKFQKAQWIAVLSFAIIPTAIIGQTIKNTHPENMARNFSDRAFLDFTTDWVNYIEACKWAEENLPDTAVVLCRKPNIGWVYTDGSKKLKGLYRVPSTTPDSIKSYLEKQKVTHVIMANLRIDPRKKTQRTINTVNITMAHLTKKYPTSFNLLKQIGSDEEAYVFEYYQNEKFTDPDLFFSCLESSVKVNPKNALFFRQQYNVLIQQKKYDKLINYAERVIKSDKETKTDLFALGFAYSKKSEWEKAASYFTKSVQLDPEYAHGWYNLGVCSLNLKNYTNAIKELKEAERLGYRIPNQLKKYTK